VLVNGLVRLLRFGRVTMKVEMVKMVHVRLWLLLLLGLGLVGEMVASRVGLVGLVMRMVLMLVLAMQDNCMLMLKGVVLLVLVLLLLLLKLMLMLMAHPNCVYFTPHHPLSHALSMHHPPPVPDSNNVYAHCYARHTRPPDAASGRLDTPNPCLNRPGVHHRTKHVVGMGVGAMGVIAATLRRKDPHLGGLVVVTVIVLCYNALHMRPLGLLLGLRLRMCLGLGLGMSLSQNGLVVVESHCVCILVGFALGLTF